LPARTAENGISRLLQTAPPKNQDAENCVRSEAAVMAMRPQLPPLVTASFAKSYIYNRATPTLKPAADKDFLRPADEVLERGEASNCLDLCCCCLLCR